MEAVNSNKETFQVLSDVVTSTLEDWAMMLTDSISLDDFREKICSDGYVAQIKLNGPFPGLIKILATKEFATVLHQNLAGEMDDTIAEDEIMDCLKEMANITAGRVITEFFGENAVYDLTDLSCAQSNIEDINEFKLENTTSIVLLGDDCPVGFTLELK